MHSRRRGALRRGCAGGVLGVQFKINDAANACAQAAHRYEKEK